MHYNIANFKYKFICHARMTYRDPCEQLAVILIIWDMQCCSVYLRYKSASCVPHVLLSDGLW